MMKQAIELLRIMVTLPSSAKNEEKMARFVGKHLEQLGFMVEIQNVGGGSYNAVGRLDFEKPGGTLMLGGHIDTVDATDAWTYPPYSLTIEGDLAYGLGTADMKGGLAAQLSVIEHLLQKKVLDRGSLVFVALADEERYSLGAEHLLKTGLTADFALLGEPHFDDIVVGSTGKTLLQLEVYGIAGHAARPECGVNAVDSMALFLNEINRHCTPAYQLGGRGSHCVLRIESAWSGYSMNIPTYCTALLNKQLQVNENVDNFIEELKKMHQYARIPGNILITQKPPLYGSYNLPQYQRDLCLLEEVAAKHNHRPERSVMQSVSDANILVPYMNIPTVLFGPRGFDYHHENEHLSLSTMDTFMRILSDFIPEFFKQTTG